VRLKIKHPDAEYSRKRYDPQRKIIDDSSIKEAIILLEAEGRGAARPDLEKGEPNIDFKIKGPGRYLYLDGMRQLDSQSKKRTIEIKCILSKILPVRVLMS